MTKAGNIILFGSIMIMTLLASCKKCEPNESTQHRIYCDYEVMYDENEDRTHAVARFRFGGPTGALMELDATKGASVTFDDEPLEYNIWYGGHHKQYPGKLTGGTFKYTDEDGKVYTNTTPDGEELKFEPGFDTIKKSVTETVGWEGTSLGTNQQVDVFVGSWAWGEKAVFFANKIGDTAVILSATKKEDLALGSSVVYMDRSAVAGLVEGTEEGGRIRYKYRCPNTTVQVIE